VRSRADEHNLAMVLVVAAGAEKAAATPSRLTAQEEWTRVSLPGGDSQQLGSSLLWYARNANRLLWEKTAWKVDQVALLKSCACGESSVCPSPAFMCCSPLHPSPSCRWAIEQAHQPGAEGCGGCILGPQAAQAMRKCVR